MDSLASYLDSLHDDGQLDSTGHFTVSLHALGKLRKFQLTNLDLYVVRLVAAGVALGATHLEGISTKASFDLIMRGVFVNSDSLTQLFEHLLSGEGDDGLRNLAVGLNSALERKPAPRILVSSWWEGKRAGIDIVQEGPQLRVNSLEIGDLPVPGGIKKGLHIRIFRRLTKGLMDSLFSGGASPERDALRGITRFSPVPLVLNGETMHERLYFRSALGVCLRVQPEVGPPILTALDALQKKTRVWLTAEPSELLFSSAVVFTVDGPHGIFWIQNGIIVRHDQLPGVGLVLVHCPNLRLDISYQNLVEDELYRQIRERIQLDCDELTEALTHAELNSQEGADVAAWVSALISRTSAGLERTLRLWQLMRQNWRIQTDPNEWRKREKYLDEQSTESFREDLLAALGYMWRRGKSLNPLRELALAHLSEEPCAWLLLGEGNMRAPWSLLHRAEECFRTGAEFPWDSLPTLEFPEGALDFLVQANLHLAEKNSRLAHDYYERASEDFPAETSEGLLLCKIVDPATSFLGKVLEDSHTGLPGESHDMGVLMTGFRFLREIGHQINEAPDWRKAVAEIRRDYPLGGDRTRLYADTARTLMVRDKIREGVLVLLVWHREVEILRGISR